MSELINVTIYMAQNFYNIQNRHLLEAIFWALHPIEELFIAHADGGQGDGLVPAGGEDDLPCQAGGDGVGGGDGHQDDWDHSHQK